MAIRQATRSQCRHRVGAVVAAGARVLAGSPNRRRNDPTIDFRHATFHAEEAALRRAGRTEGAVVYVARVNRAGVPMLARPCPRCQLALAAAGITRVYYTTGPTETGTMLLLKIGDDFDAGSGSPADTTRLPAATSDGKETGAGSHECSPPGSA
ncbi:deaminase [Streptomyces sp. NPDC051909]|uniref:deaminase n=1 Tax=Streptomyces sp. NPDC051909 TaxID=3154944 RepID=UPI0034291F07